MTELISRAGWGARPPKAVRTVPAAGVLGVAVHWLGVAVPASVAAGDRAAAIHELQQLQAYYQDQGHEGQPYSDIAYNVAVDNAGRVYELRGLKAINGANGNETVNEEFIAIVGLIGPGSTPSAAMIAGFQYAVQWVRNVYPKALQIKTHNQVRPRPTACPGPELTAAVAAGRLNPAAPKPPTPARPAVSLARIVDAARRDPSAPQGHTTHPVDVRLVEGALMAEHLLDARWVDGSFGAMTLAAYSLFQKRALGATGSVAQPGSGADGVPGPKSLALLGARHGFNVTA